MRRQSSHCCKYLQLYNPYPQHELRSNYGTQRFSKIRGTVMVFYCGWRGRGRESTFGLLSGRPPPCFFSATSTLVKIHFQPWNRTNLHWRKSLWFCSAILNHPISVSRVRFCFVPSLTRRVELERRKTIVLLFCGFKYILKHFNFQHIAHSLHSTTPQHHVHPSFPSHRAFAQSFAQHEPG